MKEKPTDTEVFEKHTEEIYEIGSHYEGCRHFNSGAPMCECSCYCYEKQVFEIGRRAEREESFA